MANWVLRANGDRFTFDGDELLELAIEAFLEKFPGNDISDIDVSREGSERPECISCQYGRIEGERWNVQTCRSCKVLS